VISHDFCPRRFARGQSGNHGVVGRYALERQFGRIAGITEMTSASQLAPRTSRFNSIWIEHQRGSRDVQAAINARWGSCRLACRACRITAG